MSDTKPFENSDLASVATDPKHSGFSAMLSALASIGPNPENRERLHLFGQFIGSWDVDIVYYTMDGGTRRRLSGEWHFSWVLEGRAIQDVWIAPKRALRASEAIEEYGATIRFYDWKLDAWRSTWIGPVKGLVLPFIARKAADEIVLDGTFEEGKLTRWIFSNITPSAFHWRAVESRDGWKTEHLEQEMFAQRIVPST